MKRSTQLAGLVAAVLVLVAAVVRDNAVAVTGPAVVRLDQGWDAANEAAFYQTSQGSVIMPAAWLAALDAPSGDRFMAPANMERLGFMLDDRGKSPGNPYGWPVGFAISDGAKSGGVPMAGLTCAACHTGQIDYRGTAMRVDGGQTNTDFDGFKNAFAEAVAATGKDPAKTKLFEQRAVALGFPEAAIDAQFQAFYRGATASSGIREVYVAHGTPAGPGRVDALALIAQAVFNYDLHQPSNTNRATAPVNYPYLWDIGRFDWVQYNASVHQPMARNIGEALGVGAITHFVDPKTGRVLPEPDRWRTSISVRNLYLLEAMVETLKPPQWPEHVLGPIDRARAATGRELFVQNCAACHGVRRLASDATEWSLRVVPLKKIGTDPAQALNFAKDTYDAAKLGLSSRETAGPGLQAVVKAIRDQAYIDDKIPPAEWPAYDGHGRKNLIASPCGYKARPLVGVWATPPFLHNGSVRSIYELLGEVRPKTFMVGSTEYDPKQLGFVQLPGSRAVSFDTSVAGNSNQGHWFTDNRTRHGRIGPRLSEPQKYALIEYLKSATYSGYPVTTVQTPDPLPCAKETAWTASYGAQTVRR